MGGEGWGQMWPHLCMVEERCPWESIAYPACMMKPSLGEGMGFDHLIAPGTLAASVATMESALQLEKLAAIRTQMLLGS